MNQAEHEHEVLPGKTTCYGCNGTGHTMAQVWDMFDTPAKYPCEVCGTEGWVYDDPPPVEAPPTSEPEDRGVNVRPRGIGKGHSLCWVCGTNPTSVQHEMAMFVDSKADGERVLSVLSFLGGQGRLDFRPSEPDWIQVKLGACEGEHLHQLDHLYELLRTNPFTKQVVHEAMSFKPVPVEGTEPEVVRFSDYLSEYEKLAEQTDHSRASRGPAVQAVVRALRAVGETVITPAQEALARVPANVQREFVECPDCQQRHINNIHKIPHADGCQWHKSRQLKQRLDQQEGASS